MKNAMTIDSRNVNLTNAEIMFIKETLEALTNGARIGERYYSVILPRIEFDELIRKKMKHLGGGD